MRSKKLQNRKLSERSSASTPREIALSLLKRVENDGAYPELILSSPPVTNLNPRDHSFVRELVLGILRWKLRLDYTIDAYYAKSPQSLIPGIRNIIRLGLFQMMFMNSIPQWAAVNECVEIARAGYGQKTAGLVNAILRQFGREGEPQPPGNPVDHIAIELSHPQWLVKRWIENYGYEKARLICQAGNEKHPLCIRVNPIKSDRDSLSSLLTNEGFACSVVETISGYIVVSKGEGLFKTSFFHDGFFTVQDPSSGMASLLLAPQPGETVLDLCSAPGGKSTHCAELMHNEGHITSVDLHSSRIGLVKDASRRLGLTIIECVVGDAGEFGQENQRLYDRVLVDVPCTGTAVFSKRPDMKWRKTEEDIIRLSSYQYTLLEHSAGLVKTGGVIVYSTCSLEPEENEKVVEKFLNRHSEFVIERDARFTEFETASGYTIFPYQMYGIGAFASKMKLVY